MTNNSSSKAVSQIVQSFLKDEIKAVEEIAEKLTLPNLAGVIFFCSSHYNLEKLAQGLNSHLLSTSGEDLPVIGCTTGGEIFEKYSENSLVVLFLSKDAFFMRTLLVENINEHTYENKAENTQTLNKDLSFIGDLNNEKCFAFVLTDGLSMKEEIVASQISLALKGIPMLGGSAGDDFDFKETQIFHQNKFYSNALAIAVLEVKDDFSLIRIQHFIPSEKELITTEVDESQRLIKEIDGEPAALAYARINDLDVDKLSIADFSRYPLMLNISGNWYIRSIAQANPDHSLSLYCAIEAGLPLTIAKGVDIDKNLEAKVEEILEEYEQIDFTLGCDCVLRRLEIFEKNKVSVIEDLFAKINFMGFNSYGEQFDGIHFNQTLSAVVIGRKKSASNGRS
jgi:hypothetical protein